MPLKEIRQAAPQPSPVEPTPPRPPGRFSPHVPVIPPRSGHSPTVPAPFPKDIDYPSYDGVPMADNTDQADEMTDDFKTLQVFFRDREDVFVATNLLVYYREGDNETRVTPDVMVAFGRPPGYRGSYKIWEEGNHPPDWVLEIASEGTAKVDTEKKPGTYAEIGVREYWQYDPTGGLLVQRLQGWRLTERGYTELPQVPVDGAEIAIYSEVLGLRLEFDGERLRFWDPVDKRYLHTPLESEVRWLEAESRAEAADRGWLEAESRAEAADRGRLEAESRAEAAERGRLKEAQARRAAERRAEAAERDARELRDRIASERTGTQPPDGSED